MGIFNNNLTNIKTNSEGESIISFPKQPWEVKTSRTYNDYIVECAMRMFTGTYFGGDKVNIKDIAKKSISRSKMFVDELVKAGYLSFDD